MKKIFYTLLMMGVLLIPNACVDDYTDANPPHLLDAPTLRIKDAVGDDHIFSTVAINQYQNGYKDMTTYDAPVVYTVSVIDAPGKIGDISVSASIPDYGTAALDEASVAAVKGKVTGEFQFTFTPNADFADKPDRALNIVVTVSDMQKDDKGEDSPLTTTLTMPVTLVNCLTEGLEGVYQVTAASGQFDKIGSNPAPNDGSAYTLDDIEAEAGDNIYVEITEVRPGLYTIDEVTGGIWSVFYTTRANPALDVDFCGTEISGHFGAVTTGLGGGAQRKFTINGTLNEDGTVDITWSYVRETGTPPTEYAFGSYTLTKVE